MEDPSMIKIAVVGGGVGGMAALKELRDVGFDVTLFERRTEVGGIWTWTEDRSVTTALQQTRLCNSKFTLGYSDFPIPAGEKHDFESSSMNEVPLTSRQDTPPYLSTPQLSSYLISYARHFNLYKDIEFGKTVVRFERSEDPTKKWQLTFEDEPDTPRQFDKVVWATGGFINPRPFEFEGQEKFTGRIIHSQEVRNLQNFRDQNVIVLGLGNTAGDVSISLAPVAKKVYLSHRRGTKILRPSGTDGLPVDIAASQTVTGIMALIETYLPSVFGWIMDSVADSSFRSNWGENKAEWGFSRAAPSIGDGFHTIMCNDDLIPLVKEGKITSTRGIKRITGPKRVELDDGSVLEDVDTIIACVGYTSDLGMLSEALTAIDAPRDAAPLPNLYMGIFPPEHSDSLALLSNVHHNGPQMPGRELSAMAVAQIWAGNSSLPSRPAMDAWVRKHQAWLWNRIARAPGLHRGDVLALEWMKVIHEAAGTAMYEHLGWGWNAWTLWYRDPELYRALAHGPAHPHAFRLFETGKRKAWKGARQALLDVNNEVKVLKEAAAANKKLV